MDFNNADIGTDNMYDMILIAISIMHTSVREKESSELLRDALEPWESLQSRLVHTKKWPKQHLD